MSPRRLADALSLEDLALWQAYTEREPWDESRADYRAAIVAYTTWAASYAGTGRQPPRSVTLEDFLVIPDTKPQRKMTDPAEMEQMFRGLHAQMQEVRHGHS